MTYNKHSITFLTDYDRANPMSEKEANMKYISKMKEAGELDTKHYEEQMKMFIQQGRLGGVINYGVHSNNMQTRVLNTYQPMMIAGVPLTTQPAFRQVHNYQLHNPNQRYLVRAIVPTAPASNNRAGYVRQATSNLRQMQAQNPVPFSRAMVMNTNAFGQPQAYYQRPIAQAITRPPVQVIYAPQPQPYSPQVYPQPIYSQQAYPQPVYQQPVYQQQVVNQIQVPQPNVGMRVPSAGQPVYFQR